MRKTIDEILEFNKVKEQIANFAVLDCTKENINKLNLINNINALNNKLDEISALISLNNINKFPSLNSIKNIESVFLRLKNKAPLNIIELLNISSNLTLIKELKTYRSNFNFDTSIDYLFDKLTLLDKENNNIKSKIENEEKLYDNASETLLNLSIKKTNLKNKINSVANSLINKYDSYLQEPIVASKEGRICLPFKIEFKNKIDGTILSISNSSLTCFIEPREITNINNEIVDIDNLILEETNKILYELSSQFFIDNENLNILKTNYETLLYFDELLAKSMYAINTNSHHPIISDKKVIDLKNARHPLIDKNICVPLDINLGINFRELIITGPNTGGKTVSLKTTGLLTLMALSGLFIPASDNSIVGNFNTIYADIGDDQSIEQSLSTFSSHITNISSIINEADENSLCLFDEICTGTDPLEGANLAISILKYLLDKNISVIATTHYPEIKIFALNTENVTNGAFEFNVETLKPTYKLLIGIPGKSNAFRISEKLGLKKEIIDNAKSLMSNNDIRFEDIISDLEESKITIDREKREVEKYKKEIESLKDNIRKHQKSLNKREESIIKNAREEARSILISTKALVNDTIKNIKKEDRNLNDVYLEKSKIDKNLSDISESLVEKVRGPHNPLSPKKVTIGMKVKILSLDMDGSIATLPDKDYNLFVNSGALRLKVNLKDLEKLSDKEIKSMTKTPKKSYSSDIKMDKSKNSSTEINLIGLNTMEAIEKLDKFIDDAYLAHAPRVRIIHGRGTYALRDAVHKLLKKSTIVKEFNYADAYEGGDGATIVTFN